MAQTHTRWLNRWTTGCSGAAGQTTCAGRAGGLYNEYTDAQTYADWGAQYVSVSLCLYVSMSLCIYV